MTTKTEQHAAHEAGQHATLIEALIAAQSEYPGIPKEATGQARGGRYQYATLPAVLEAVVPSLNRHGIALIQRTAIDGEALTLHTILRHTSGEEVSSVVPLPSPASWQDWGSALTYARRYSITALAGVAPDVDDDGATAQGRPATVARPIHPPTDDLGWGDPREAAAAASAAVRPPTPNAPKMPVALAQAPLGVCEVHKMPWYQPKNKDGTPHGGLGHYFTPNPPRGDGKGEWCHQSKPKDSPSLAEQAAQIAAARGPTDPQDYRDVGSGQVAGGRTKEGQGQLA